MSKPILYIKSKCPWCKDALEFFKSKGIKLNIVDVLENPDSLSEMAKLSGQCLTPTFILNDCVIADFSVEEFKEAIEKYPTVKSAIGLS